MVDPILPDRSYPPIFTCFVEASGPSFAAKCPHFAAYGAATAQQLDLTSDLAQDDRKWLLSIVSSKE